MNSIVLTGFVVLFGCGGSTAPRAIGSGPVEPQGDSLTQPVDAATATPVGATTSAPEALGDSDASDNHTPVDASAAKADTKTASASKRPPNPAFEACQAEFQDAVNGTLTAALLSDAAACYGGAGMMGREVLYLDLLIKRFPNSLQARDAFVRQGRAYEAAHAYDSTQGFLTRAATAYEGHAARFGAESGGVAALIRAACFRHQAKDRENLEKDLRRLGQLAPDITDGVLACKRAGL